MNNTITLNWNSTRADRSKYHAQCAVSSGRHMITLREARENAKRSTKEAAEVAGVTEKTYKRWEIDCGKANTFAISRLCMFYGISMEHVHAGKEADLLAARIEVGTVEDNREMIKVEDLIAVFKRRGLDTTEIEVFVEEISKGSEAETKNAPSVGAPETFSESVM